MTTMTLPAVNPLDYGRAPRPVCPKCRVEMRAVRTAEVIRYWRCPVPGCCYRGREVKGTRHASVYRCDESAT